MLVVCNGMLRSGSTLQYNIVRLLVERSKSGTAHGYFGAPPEELERWSREGELHALKTHEIHPEVFSLASAGRCRVCYTYRDIRDVAVSARRKWRQDWPSLLQGLDRAIGIDQQMRGAEGVLIQRYEDVVRALPAAVEEIAGFLELNVDKSLLEGVAADCSLDALREKNNKFSIKERISHIVTKRSASIPAPLRRVLRATGVSTLVRRVGLKRDVYDSNTLLHPDHFSQSGGAPNTWKRALKLDEQTELTARYGVWLKELGYL